jgi:predicted acetylornithine/succinylornithine family transaminase
MKASASELLKLQQSYVMGTYTPELLLVKGQGAKLWDTGNREFLDFGSGISVCNLGHCHPHVTAAIRRQAGELVHVSNLYMNPNQPFLAGMIACHTFGGRVFFCNSGAEANEGMIKFARKWGSEAGKYEIVAMEDSFHGRTLATLAATGRAKYRKGFQPDVQGFVHVPFNDIDAVREACGEKTCAVLVEPVQGEGGVVPATPDFLQQVRKLCDERGILLLFDEVQCGMGRTTKFFAYQHYGVEPDAMAMAKALANGYPLGAFEVRQEHAHILGPGTHASTFGGSPLACAAGIAVFEVFEQQDILGHATAVAAYLWQRLGQLKEKHTCIKEVRGLGLMVGIVTDTDVNAVIAAARKKGLIVLSAGEGVVRLLPPLIVSKQEIDQAVAVLHQVLP